MTLRAPESARCARPTALTLTPFDKSWEINRNCPLLPDLACRTSGETHHGYLSSSHSPCVVRRSRSWLARANAGRDQTHIKLTSVADVLIILLVLPGNSTKLIADVVVLFLLLLIVVEGWFVGTKVKRLAAERFPGESTRVSCYIRRCAALASGGCGCRGRGWSAAARSDRSSDPPWRAGSLPLS